jgi:hypothetical protein
MIPEPTLLRLEIVTPEPNVVEVRTEVSLI